MKLCKTCNVRKKNSEFYKSVSNECIACKIVRSTKNKLLLDYGISYEEKMEMAKQQNYRCACCGDGFKDETDICVDHCHKTGNLRELLCQHCNKGLGLFEDLPWKLERAKKYLERHAKENTTPPVPAGDNREGEVSPEHGAIPAAGSREDYYDLDHYQRAVRGEDSDYRTQTRGGDSMGHGGEEVGAPQAPQSLEDYGVSGTEIISIEYGIEYIPDKP